MNDEDLERRFDELRSEEMQSIPRFHSAPRHRRVFATSRLVSVAAAFVIFIVILAAGVAHRRATFDHSDEIAARSVAAWNPPTAFLLKTPGREFLSTTPVIPDVPDLKGSLQ